MPIHRDVKGYYATLAVDVSASPEEIKKSFRIKALEFHPDRNPLPEATEQFQLLNEAYRVLNNPVARADYDALCSEDSSADRPFEPGNYPVECSVCGKVSSQLRYAVYQGVVSFVIASWQHQYAGVVCAECGAKRAYAGSTITWLLGWWGIPFGPFRSVRAIASNMAGGEQPALENFRLLGQQTVYFLSIRRFDLARQVCDQALEFIKNIAATERGQVTLADWQLRDYLQGVQADTPSPALRKRNRWGRRGMAFRIQAAGAALAIVLLLAGAFAALAPRSAVPTWAGRQSATADSESLRTAQANPEHAELHPIPMPPTGVLEAFPNSEPPHLADSVAAPLQIVNSKGDRNYLIKLTDWQTHAVRMVIFVRSGDTATFDVPTGDYEIRYAQGQTWYGVSNLFGPETLYGRISGRFQFIRKGREVEGYTLQLVKRPIPQ
jgi:hypothetical protein